MTGMPWGKVVGAEGCTATLQYISLTYLRPSCLLESAPEDEGRRAV